MTHSPPAWRSAIPARSIMLSARLAPDEGVPHIAHADLIQVTLRPIAESTYAHPAAGVGGGRPAARRRDHASHSR